MKVSLVFALILFKKKVKLRKIEFTSLVQKWRNIGLEKWYISLLKYQYKCFSKCKILLKNHIYDPFMMQVPENIPELPSFSEREYWEAY